MILLAIINANRFLALNCYDHKLPYFLTPMAQWKAINNNDPSAQSSQPNRFQSNWLPSRRHVCIICARFSRAFCSNLFKFYSSESFMGTCDGHYRLITHSHTVARFLFHLICVRSASIVQLYKLPYLIRPRKWSKNFVIRLCATIGRLNENLSDTKFVVQFSARFHCVHTHFVNNVLLLFSCFLCCGCCQFKFRKIKSKIKGH